MTMVMDNHDKDNINFLFIIQSPKFLETHVNKLKEAWDVAIMAANVR